MNRVRNRNPRWMIVPVVVLLSVLLVSSFSLGQERTKIVFSVANPAYVEEGRSLIAKFEELNPDIEVEITVRGDYNVDKLLTQLVAGIIPDVLDQAPIGVNMLHEGGWLLDVTDYVERSPLRLLDTNAYVPFSDLYKRDGRIWGGLETHFQTYPLFYNADHFLVAGLADPNSYAMGTWTWDDFLDAAKKLTVDKNGDGQPDQWGYLNFGQNWELGWLPWLTSNGVELFSEDKSRVNVLDEKALEALEFYVSLLRDQNVSVHYSQAGFDANGVTSMLVGGTFHQRSFLAGEPFNWDIAVPPVNPGADYFFYRAPASAGVVMKGTQHPDEAWRFVEFLLAFHAQEERAVARTAIPVQLEALETYTNPPPPHIREVLPFMIEHSEAILPFPGQNEALSAVAEQIVRAINGEVSVRAAMEIAADVANARLAEVQGR